MATKVATSTNGQAEVTVKRVSRQSHLEWVPVAATRVSPLAQRELRRSFVLKIAKGFDPENLGFPVVSFRGDLYWVIDGQHRFEALKEIGWGDQQVQCEVYRGLTEEEEAEEFLKRQQRIPVSTLDQFTIAITAGREVECDIDRIVRSQGLKVGKAGPARTIVAVATLRYLYLNGSPMIMRRTIHMAYEAFGDAGLGSNALKGLGMVLIKYENTLVSDEKATAKLKSHPGGLGAIITKAQNLNKSMGRPMVNCIGAVIVEVLNAGRTGFKLANWWRDGG